MSGTNCDGDGWFRYPGTAAIHCNGCPACATPIEREAIATCALDGETREECNGHGLILRPNEHGGVSPIPHDGCDRCAIPAGARHGHPCDHATGVCEDAPPNCPSCATPFESRVQGSMARHAVTFGQPMSEKAKALTVEECDAIMQRIVDGVMLCCGDSTTGPCDHVDANAIPSPSEVVRLVRQARALAVAQEYGMETSSLGDDGGSTSCRASLGGGLWFYSSTMAGAIEKAEKARTP